MPHHFFIPPTAITPPIVTMPPEVARQIRTVLRGQIGDEMVVLDNSGLAYRVSLTHVDKQGVRAQIIAPHTMPPEPPLHVTLYQGVLKGAKFEWVLQKGTEIGVSHFVPLLCERAIIREAASLEKKYERWQRIIQEAAEQSRRAILPQLAPPLELTAALAQRPPQTTLLMAWEEATRPIQQLFSVERPSQVALLIGPEGGFTSAEAAQVQQAGGAVVSLGPRILRAETASLVASSFITMLPEIST